MPRSGPMSADDQRTGLLRAPGVEAAARSDKGPVRERNEDAFVCRPELGLFGVIDGMGGQQAGPEAASIARDAMLAQGDVVRALWSANERIQRRAQQEKSLTGMGCVASVMRLQGRNARVAHVGDTRVYLAGSAGCEQLTRDHTIAAHRQEELGITDRDARTMEGHNQVTRDLGGRRRDDQDWIDQVTTPLVADDIVLLCSDGLHGVVPTSDLFPLLRAFRKDGAAVDALADTLVSLALDRGTRDNVTAVVVRLKDTRNPDGAR